MDISKITIADVCTEWLNMKKLSVKQSTYAKYHYIIKTEILPELGDYPLEKMNSSIINAFTSRKLGVDPNCTDRRLASKTVRDIYTILKSVLRYGENEYHTGPLAANTVLPKPKRESIETLTMMELRKIAKYLWERPWDARCVGLLLCMYSGMRLGEICALKWEDVDLDKKTIYIRHTMQRITVPEENGESKTRIVVDEPKTQSSMRLIPISDEIYPLIKNLHRFSGANAYFLSNTERFVEPRNYQYFFKSILKKTEIRNVNFHILRHTFATQCVEVGMDIKTLSEILGHSSTNITLTYYVHSSLETKQKQVNLLKI
ncbi:MAG: site-specific integrase [Eubacteriales bacterium]|nr:site-specific integrase [Eubacteriales bacterium]